MNGIQFFTNPQFGQIRTAGTPDQPLFCGNDIAKALGYLNPKAAVRTHSKGGCVLTTPSNGGPQKMRYITEGDLYRLIVNSRLPEAEKFESWIFDEVLPSIRRTGGYIKAEESDSDADIMAKALLIAQRTVEERERKIQMLEGERNLLQEKVEAMTDKAQYTDEVLQSTETATFEQMSKELNFPSVYKFIDRLKSDGIIYKRSDMYMLYAQYCGKGLTATRTYRFYHRDGRPGTNTRTVWTQAGRKWLHERYAS